MRSEKCVNCAERCPMADMAHEAAKGRMYAMNEFIDLWKKVESGQLVEVVRCGGCKHWRHNLENGTYCSIVGGLVNPEEDDFCSYGERENNV